MELNFLENELIKRDFFLSKEKNKFDQQHSNTNINKKPEIQNSKLNNQEEIVSKIKDENLKQELLKINSLNITIENFVEKNSQNSKTVVAQNLSMIKNSIFTSNNQNITKLTEKALGLDEKEQNFQFFKEEIFKAFTEIKSNREELAIDSNSKYNYLKTNEQQKQIAKNCIEVKAEREFFNNHDNFSVQINNKASTPSCVAEFLFAEPKEIIINTAHKKLEIFLPNPLNTEESVRIINKIFAEEKLDEIYKADSFKINNKYFLEINSNQTGKFFQDNKNSISISTNNAENINIIKAKNGNDAEIFFNGITLTSNSNIFTPYKGLELKILDKTKDISLDFEQSFNGKKLLQELSEISNIFQIIKKNVDRIKNSNNLAIQNFNQYYDKIKLILKPIEKLTNFTNPINLEQKLLSSQENEKISSWFKENYNQLLIDIENFEKDTKNPIIRYLDNILKENYKNKKNLSSEIQTSYIKQNKLFKDLSLTIHKNQMQELLIKELVRTTQ
ncbi:MAG: hypothetical protein ISN64_00935 [Rickettsia sp.]|nr:hypothetical protein [Rickettsia sp.]